MPTEHCSECNEQRTACTKCDEGFLTQRQDMCVVDGPLRLMEHMSFGVLKLLTYVRIYVKSLVLTVGIPMT